MKNWKLFYSFRCPLGVAPDVKLGVTQQPETRLGVYQTSYSYNSHVASFDTVFIGPERSITNLEKQLKLKYNWKVERDGRGASEWIANTSIDDINNAVHSLIDSHKFKAFQIDPSFLPLTADTVNSLKAFYHLE